MEYSRIFTLIILKTADESAVFLNGYLVKAMI